MSITSMAAEQAAKPRKKNYQYFVGTDVSRNKLDHAVMQGKALLFHKVTANDKTAVDEFIRELKAIKGFTISRTIFCMEQTGVYCNHLVDRLQKVKANIALEGPMHIRNSMGNIRAKSDKIDAIRIAEFAYKCRDELRFYVPKRPVIVQLAQLVVLRERMLGTQGMLRMPLKEEATFVKARQAQLRTRLCQRSIDSITGDLKEIDLAIEALWRGDERLSRLMLILNSVDCIGPVTALKIILTTNEFKSISNPKKFACYAGVAPFVRESGTFKGRARVSHMANKKMKSLLHMCALNASRTVPDFKQYMERKMTEEGKNKMLVLNNLRYKLILRAFACVNQDRLYEKNYVRPGPINLPTGENVLTITENELTINNN